MLQAEQVSLQQELDSQRVNPAEYRKMRAEKARKLAQALAARRRKVEADDDLRSRAGPRHQKLVPILASRRGKVGADHGLLSRQKSTPGRPPGRKFVPALASRRRKVRADHGLLSRPESAPGRPKSSSQSSAHGGGKLRLTTGYPLGQRALLGGPQRAIKLVPVLASWRRKVGADHGLLSQQKSTPARAPEMKLIPALTSRRKKVDADHTLLSRLESAPGGPRR